jgi:phage regulator Rha-like protein
MNKWLKETLRGLDMGITEDVALVDSMSMAQNLDIEYKTMLQTVSEYSEALEDLDGKLRVELVKFEDSRKKRKVYWFTESQAWFILSLSQNTEQVVDLKFRLVKAFKDLKNRIGDFKSRIRDSKTSTIQIHDYLFKLFPGDFSKTVMRFRSMVNSQMRKELGVEGQDKNKAWVMETHPEFLERYAELETVGVKAFVGKSLGMDEHASNIFRDQLKQQQLNVESVEED